VGATTDCAQLIWPITVLRPALGARAGRAFPRPLSDCPSPLKHGPASRSPPSAATLSDKIEEEKKLDGIFVLRTNTDLNPLEAMLCYKQPFEQQSVC
jgi:hypothetical protein